jgi:hypothetical protein
MRTSGVGLATSVLAWSACRLESARAALVQTEEPAGLSLTAVLRDEAALTGAHDIQIRDGLAYIAGKGFTQRNLPASGVFPYAAGKGGSVAIVNVKQPEAPQILWYAKTPLAYEDAETVLPLGDQRLLLGARDLFLFDVSDPATPRQLGAIVNRPHVDTINGFARFDDAVFAANKQGYIFAVDVSARDTITMLGMRETRERNELGRPHDAARFGELLAVVSPEGFGAEGQPGRVAIYRVAEPGARKPLAAEQWTLVGRLEHPRLAGANRVRTYGKFICSGNSLTRSAGRSDNLRPNTAVLDLADPSRPRLCASLDFPDERGPNGLEIAGTVLFAAGGRTVQAVDISNPQAPRELARFSSVEAFPGGADDAHDLVYHDGHLFVTAQTSHSLVILRVSEDLRKRVAGTR